MRKHFFRPFFAFPPLKCGVEMEVLQTFRHFLVICCCAFYPICSRKRFNASERRLYNAQAVNWIWSRMRTRNFKAQKKKLHLVKLLVHALFILRLFRRRFKELSYFENFSGVISPILPLHSASNLKILIWFMHKSALFWESSDLPKSFPLVWNSELLRLA